MEPCAIPICSKCKDSFVEGRPLDDAELVKRAKEGDARAYEQLVLRYQDVAVRAAYLIAGDEAEDAAQEAFLKAFYALKRFRLGAPFRPWLLKIVANEARNRRKSSRRRSELIYQISGGASGGAAPSPEAATLQRESDEQVFSAVLRLNRKDQSLIGCRYFLDLSEAETASLLRIPKGTVKSRLSRALHRLRDELAEPSSSIERVQEGVGPDV